jgi:hypothetical protein
MKKIFLILFILLFIVGCGGNNKKLNKYQIRIEYSGSAIEQSTSFSSNIFAMGVDTANNPVIKNDFWWTTINPHTDNFSIGKYVNDQYTGQGTCTAIITDLEGNIISISPEEEKEIVWTTLDSNPSDLVTINESTASMTGTFIAFNANGPGVARFTARYKDSSATTQIVFMNHNMFYLGQGYIFASNTITPTIDDADWWIEKRENGIYLCTSVNSTDGISKILDPEEIVPGRGISWQILGCVHNVPENLKYEPELLKGAYCSYIIKMKSGAYVKLQTIVDDVGASITFLYEYSTNTEFTNHF